MATSELDIFEPKPKERASRDKGDKREKGSNSSGSETSSLPRYPMSRLLVVLGLALGGAFVIASLASVDPADAASAMVFPMHAIPRNWCGPLGAQLAAEMLTVTGLGGFTLGLGMILLSLRVLQRRSPLNLIRASLGVLMLTAVTAAWAQRTAGVGRLNTVEGPGGQIGLLIHTTLQANVASVGACLVLAALTVLGLTIALEDLVPIAARGLWALLDKLMHLIAGRVAMVASALSQWAAARREAWQQRRAVRLAELAAEKEAAAQAAEEAAAKEEAPRILSVTPRVNSMAANAAVETTSSEAEETGEEEYEEYDEESLEYDEESEAVEAAAGTESPVVRHMQDDPLKKHLELGRVRPELAVPERSEYQLPDIELLEEVEPFEFSENDEQLIERAGLLEEAFKKFKMGVKVVEIHPGPVVTQYEIELEDGLQVQKVKARSEDLAISMRAQSVRIVAPIPGKNTIGVEVPNLKRAKVCMREVMQSTPLSAKMKLPLYLGKDVKGQTLVYDLAKMPHLLIAGRTGTGKSVCLNAMILSILMTRTPDEVKLLMIDPKMVELSLYNDIPHLMHPVVTDMKKAEALLAWAVDKMEQRYSLLAKVKERHIEGFNKLTRDQVLERLGSLTEEEYKAVPDKMPYIVIIADEMADLMMTAAKEVEAHIIRLAQKSRAVGIHLVLATQKPTVDVVTGLIKSNLPARIAFQVASKTDSRVVLDAMGAESLLGDGDMLFLYPGTSSIVRAQGTYVSDNEVTTIADFLASQGGPDFSQELIELKATSSEDREGAAAADSGDRDSRYEEAVEVVLREQRGSTSLLQRAMGIGYGRAARMIDDMYSDGIVGEYNGSQAREILYTWEEWQSRRAS